MLKMPNRLEDITMLPIRIKPDWTGFEARLVGLLAWVGVKLRIKSARLFLEDFHTVLGGVLYAPIGKRPNDVSLSMLMHEGLHDWQKKEFWFYRSRYLLSKKQRAHFEAQAYALEVWGFGRSIASAVRSHRRPIYGLHVSRKESLALISSYVKAWTDRFGPLARSEFEDYPESPGSDS